MLVFLKKIPSFIIEIFIIVIISVMAATLTNKYRLNGISYDETLTKAENMEKYHFISIDHAKEEFHSGHALFVDARQTKSFENSHIKGAVNFPADNKDEKAFDFIKNYQDKNISIIVYCDGVECHLSHEIFEYLSSLGYTNSKILINGLSLWQEHHLPLDTKEKHQEEETKEHH